MIVTKDVKVSVNIRQARAALCVAGYSYEEIRRASDDDIFKMALSMSDSYGVTFEIKFENGGYRKEPPSIDMPSILADFEHLKEDHASLLADAKVLCEDTGDGCHLCKHYPCTPQSDHCLGWEWRGKSK